MITLRHPDDLSDLLTHCTFDRRALDAIERREDEDGVGWIVHFEDAMPVMLDWFDEPVRLVFSAELGMPAAERRQDVLQALMAYNALWRQTGGVRAGLAGEDEEQLLLFFEWHPGAMDVDQLPGAIERFADLAVWWADHVAHDGPGGDPPSMDLFDAALRA